MKSTFWDNFLWLLNFFPKMFKSLLSWLYLMIYICIYHNENFVWDIFVRFFTIIDVILSHYFSISLACLYEMKTVLLLLGVQNWNVMSLFLISVEQVVALDAQNIIAVSCGEAHTLALNDKGQVYAWGLDSDGQLGLLGSEECIRVPR